MPTPSNMRAAFTGIVMLSIAGCSAIDQNQLPNAAQQQAAVPAAPPTPSSQPTARRDLTVEEKTILADAFSAGLNEPDSVKFKWTKIRVISDNGRQSFEYCAQLNLKDQTGKYRGMQPFLATIIAENGVIRGGAIVSLYADDKPQNRSIIPNLCQQKGLNPFG